MLYSIVDEDKQFVYCNSDDVWKSDEPAAGTVVTEFTACEEINACPTTGAAVEAMFPTDGDGEYHVVSNGGTTVAQLVCGNGFRLEFPYRGTITCVAGKWDKDPTRCVQDIDYCQQAEDTMPDDTVNNPTPNGAWSCQRTMATPGYQPPLTVPAGIVSVGMLRNSNNKDLGVPILFGEYKVL
jgi:hypothetical protein